jgi:hypothetical protein
MAQKEKLIDKTFFDSENFEREAKKRKDLVKPVNDFLEACEPFGFEFQDTRELEQFCQSIERFGTKPVYDRLVNKLMESQATIAGFEMSRQALLDSVTFPDPEPLPHKLRDIRPAAKGNLSLIKELDFDGKGGVFLPDAILEDLKERHTITATNEAQATLMSALELTASHIANLQSLYHELNVEAQAQTRRSLLDFVKYGHVSPEAFRIVKALK